MDFIRQRLAASPAMARVFPFALVVIITFFQDSFGESARYWIYGVKTLLGAWAVWLVKPFVAEMRIKFNWQAVVVGIAMFAIWVGLDPFYPHLLSGGSTWNPLVAFPHNPAIGWSIIAVRIVGTALIVPFIEEVFYRSFLYRWIIRSDFQSIPFSTVDKRAFFITALMFGAHHEWLAGILCGAALQWLTIKKNRLGDAIVAHGITNLLLGFWVVWRGAWQFW